MFLTKIFSVGLLCVLIFSKANSTSISQIGDVRIEVGNDKWQCDRIECPIGTHRCFVSKIKEPNDPSILVRTNICYSRDNQVLAEETTTSTIDPNHKIRLQVNSYRSGVISSVNSFSSHGDENFDEEKFHKELNTDLKEMREDLERGMVDFHRGLNKQMENLNKNLHHMNHNINKGVQNGMRNLDDGMSLMSHNLDHMFD